MNSYIQNIISFSYGSICLLLSFFMTSFVKGEAQKDLILLTIDKTKLQANLQTLTEKPEDRQLLQTFKIAIGKGVGDKFRQGDNKTPEGIYFAVQHIDTSKIDIQKYGKNAVVLDFPNLMDSIEGKTGYGIWLHGAGDNNRMADKQVTEGCVAFYNEDIELINRWLVPYHAVIVIGETEDHINRPEVERIIYDQSYTWINSWRGKDIESYIQLYHKDFEGKGMGKEAYKNYKQNLFRSYKNMSIDVDHMRVITHSKYAVSIMNQKFQGDNRFTSSGRKIIYWIKDEKGEWKIFREYFGRQHFQSLAYTKDDLKNLSDLAAHDSTHAHLTEARKGS